jgi:hypothetical protein
VPNVTINDSVTIGILRHRVGQSMTVWWTYVARPNEIMREDVHTAFYLMRRRVTRFTVETHNKLIQLL